jgi:hypothetical protein
MRRRLRHLLIKRLYRAALARPREGTIAAAIEAHSRACDYVAAVFCTDPDAVARIVQGCL